MSVIEQDARAVAVIQGDVVAEFPLYTRNYVQEGGAIQLGKPERRDDEEDWPEQRAQRRSGAFRPIRRRGGTRHDR